MISALLNTVFRVCLKIRAVSPFRPDFDAVSFFYFLNFGYKIQEAENPPKDDGV
jgi:hypothetical protein